MTKCSIMVGSIKYATVTKILV